MDEIPTHLDLFSGIGGFALAAQWAGFRTIGFCEIDKYCQKVLAENFGPFTSGDNAKLFPNGTRVSQEPRSGEESGNLPIFGSNIFDLNGRQFKGVDLITGGFPCQPFSVAGKRGGAADDRAIWPQMRRVIAEAAPTFVLAENVAGIVQMELDTVLSDLEAIGYSTGTLLIPAVAVDARHRRLRVWAIGRRNVCQPKFAGLEGHAWNGLRGHVSDTAGGRQEQRLSERQQTRRFGCENKPDRGQYSCHATWLPEPDVGRVAHGISNRVDRLKGLGNAIVPQVAYEILREIRKFC